MKRMRKLRTRAGFTLAETLLTVMILLLVSSIVATGIPVAQNAYEKVVLGANAQILLSTTVAALRDELGTAKDIEISSDNTEITYLGTDTQARSKIYNGESAGKESTILLQDYVAVKEFFRGDDEIKEGTPHPLVSDTASTKDLYAVFDKVEEADGIVTFTNLRICREGSDAVLATLGKEDSILEIRVFSVENEEA